MKVGIWILRIIAALLALILAMYVIGILANLRDQPPSQTAQAFLDEIENRPPLADEDNAYLMFLGFQVPADRDPLAAGIERQAWIDEALAGGEFHWADDTISIEDDFRKQRDKAIAAISSTCMDSKNCIGELPRSDALAWLTAEPWLLERYGRLIAMPATREHAPFFALLPLPNYGNVMDAQRLWMLSAAEAARAGDSKTVLAALDADLRFWRRMLGDSDLLISKLISVAAVRQHFRHGNSVLRLLHASNGSVELPPSWEAPMSDEERSARRPIIGEWYAVHAMLRDMDQYREYLRDYDEEYTTFWESDLAWRLIQPYLQPQASSNLHAAHLDTVVTSLERDFADLWAARDELFVEFPSDAKPTIGFYNAVGRFTVHEDYTRYAYYGARASDLEGLRRAALLANELRRDGVALQDVPDAVARSAFTDPYTGLRLGWDAEEREIVTTLLSDDRPERYRIRYEGPQAAPLAARQ